MSLGISELGDFREARGAEKRSEVLTQLKQRHSDALSISRLTAHPDWERYGRYVEQEIRKHETSAKAQEKRLLDVLNPLNPIEESKIRMQLAHNRAAIEAFEFCMKIAEVLIDQGKTAAERIKVIEGMMEEKK